MAGKKAKRVFAGSLVQAWRRIASGLAHRERWAWPVARFTPLRDLGELTRRRHTSEKVPSCQWSASDLRNPKLLLGKTSFERPEITRCALNTHRTSPLGAWRHTHVASRNTPSLPFLPHFDTYYLISLSFPHHLPPRHDQHVPAASPPNQTHFPPQARSQPSSSSLTLSSYSSYSSSGSSTSYHRTLSTSPAPRAILLPTLRVRASVDPSSLPDQHPHIFPSATLEGNVHDVSGEAAVDAARTCVERWDGRRRPRRRGRRRCSDVELSRAEGVEEGEVEGEDRVVGSPCEGKGRVLESGAGTGRLRGEGCERRGEQRAVQDGSGGEGFVLVFVCMRLS